MSLKGIIWIKAAVINIIDTINMSRLVADVVVGVVVVVENVRRGDCGVVDHAYDGDAETDSLVKYVHDHTKHDEGQDIALRAIPWGAWR